MKYLLDVNALVALGFLQHEFHERVAAWVRTSIAKGTVELATCSITELGFVRILVQAPQYGFTVSQARDLLLRLKAASAFTFISDDQDISHLPGSKQQNKRPMAIWRNWRRRRGQFLQRWTVDFPAYSKFREPNESDSTGKPYVHASEPEAPSWVNLARNCETGLIRDFGTLRRPGISLIFRVSDIRQSW